MNRKRTELLEALTAAGWGVLPWSGEGANRDALRVELDGGYSLAARMYRARLTVDLCGGIDSADDVKSPADALRLIEQWERQHYARSQCASAAERELRGMMGDGV